MRHHAYDLLTYNSPLSTERAIGLVGLLGTPETALDLGCGWARLLVDLLVEVPGASGVGLDRDQRLLDRGGEEARAAGVADRLTLVAGDASAAEDTADAVIAIGVAHVWGGTRQALAALHRHLRPGGHLLYGDGGWVTEPTAAAEEVLGTDIAPLAELPAMAAAEGWTVVDVQEADQAEWDAFEEGWCLGLEAFAAATEDTTAAEEAHTLAAEHRQTYYEVYRGLLGFGYLVLTPAG